MHILPLSLCWCVGSGFLRYGCISHAFRNLVLNLLLYFPVPLESCYWLISSSFSNYFSFNTSSSSCLHIHLFFPSVIHQRPLGRLSSTWFGVLCCSYKVLLVCLCILEIVHPPFSVRYILVTVVWSNDIFVSLFVWCLKRWRFYRKWRGWWPAKIRLPYWQYRIGCTASDEAFGIFQACFPQALIPCFKYPCKYSDSLMCWITESPLGLSMNCSLVPGI